MSPDTFKTEQSVGDDNHARGSKKRKRDEVNDIVDGITFGQFAGNLTPSSLSSRYSTPSKCTKTEIDALEKEVNELAAVASQNRKRAETARTKLADRVRRRTEMERKYEDLLARKQQAQEEIAKSNRDEELYMVSMLWHSA